MIIGEVDFETYNNGEDYVKVRVDYTKEECLKLNKIVDGLCSMKSWITFTVKKDTYYADCSIYNISLYSEIDDKEWLLDSNIFDDVSIRIILDVAYKKFKEVYKDNPKNKEEIFNEKFSITGNFSESNESIPKEYCIENHDVYGTTKWD